jgi:mono/diheme cytochrome c family protein
MTMSVFIGRFHPVFVHLPIGILLFVAVLFFLSKKQKFANLSAAIAPGLAIGTLFAMVSCVTGYLLSISDTYNEAAIFKHQWLGIATTVVGGISYFAYQRASKFFGAILIVLSILIIITGHYGGSLTHGEDYITASMTSATGNKKVIANVNEAAVYKDIIEPILATKCYSCHGSSKQKGKLRLDLPNYIMQGGEDGKVLTAFEPGSSELINRLLLPTSNEEHMPPKEKPQLTQQEISLLHWWIASGANFTSLVKNTKQTATIKPILAALASGTESEQKNTTLPNKSVSAISTNVLEQLKKEGVAIVPVVAGSNYVSANLIGVENISAQTFQLLSQISDQLLQLNASFTSIKDEHLAQLSNCKQLRKLACNGTAISDKGLAYLSTLENLEILSMTQTKITDNGINGLAGLQKLQKVYLYQTGFTKAGIAKLLETRPSIKIDTGGYTLPILVTDTTEAKAPEVKTN